MMEEAPHLLFSRRTEKKKEKKPSLYVWGSVGRPTSTGHSSIKVNIYVVTFLLL